MLTDEEKWLLNTYVTAVNKRAKRVVEKLEDKVNEILDKHKLSVEILEVYGW
jgi:hypothetical protein